MKINRLLSAAVVIVGVVAFLAVGGTGQANMLTPKQILGGLLYSDTSLSLNKNQSCLTCHNPLVGAAGGNRAGHVHFGLRSPDLHIAGQHGHTSGYAVPHYVIDAPNGGGKIPLLPDYYQGRDEDGSVLLRNYQKNIYRYPDQAEAAAVPGDR